MGHLGNNVQWSLVQYDSKCFIIYICIFYWTYLILCKFILKCLDYFFSTLLIPPSNAFFHSFFDVLHTLTYVWQLKGGLLDIFFMYKIIYLEVIFTGISHFLTPVWNTEQKTNQTMTGGDMNINLTQSYTMHHEKEEKWEYVFTLLKTILLPDACMPPNQLTTTD